MIQTGGYHNIIRRITINSNVDANSSNFSIFAGVIDRLVNWYRNTFFRFEFTLDSLIHPFNYTAGNPNFSTLFTDLDKYIFKKIKMFFYQTVKGLFPSMQLSTTLGTQSIFHSIFSLLVLGSSHLAGSNQWTVII